MRRAQQPVSLKARAVHLLSQREHSESELRRKLMRAEREAVRRAALGDAALVAGRAAARLDGRRMGGVEPAEPVETSISAGDDVDTAVDASDGTALSARVEAVIVWLRAHDFLSDARFIESRVHARAAGHGLRRIRHELEQHGVTLPADTAAALRGSEFDRADAMRRRRYGDDGPATALEQARCARWLVQRGFSGDTVARVMRAMRQSASPASAASAGPRGDQAWDADEG